MTTSPAKYDHAKLFLVSLLALMTAGINFALRSSVASDLQSTFFDPLNRLTSAAMTGAVLGVASLGFAITIAIGSPLLDYLGMGRLLAVSSVCFIVGTLGVMFAGELASGPSVYWAVWGGMVVIGIGWGLVETVINPLTTAIYPKEKTARLNTLHAWWPGGIIIGGILGLALAQFGASWKLKRQRCANIPQAGRAISWFLRACIKVRFMPWPSRHSCSSNC